MRTSSTYAFAAALLSSLSVAACGQLEGEPDKLPVIATIHGQLSNPNGYAAGPSMRVAIVWGRESGSIQVSQDVPVQPIFPSQFKLDIRDLPPALAMRAPGDKNDPNAPKPGTECSPGYNPSAGGAPPSANTLCDTDAPPSAGPAPTPAAPPSGGASGGTRIQSDFRPATAADPFRIAVGTLVAYEDLNGNGQLDLLDENATQAIDRVVGVNEKLYVVYAEGTPSGELAQFGIPKGFSLLQVPECIGTVTEVSDPKVTTGTGDGTQGQGTDGAPSRGGNAPSAPAVAVEDKACDDTPHFQAIDTLFTLPLTAAARLSSFMCKGDGGFTSVDSMSGGGSAPAAHVSPVAPPPDVAYPSPTDPSLYCYQNGSGYTYTKCETPKLCGDTVCESTTVARPASAPASWPCPTH